MIYFYQQDNFFTDEESNYIDQILFDDNLHFPLYYEQHQIDNDNIPFFRHTLISRDQKVNSNFLNFFLKIFERFIKTTNLKPKNILRSCVNLTLPFQGDASLHIDHDEDHFQIIMYLNDSSGNTDIYYDNNLVKSVEPKKGRIIMFDKHYHLGNSPKKHNELRAVCVFTFDT